MSYTATQSFFLVNKNGKVTKCIKSGDIITNSVYNNLTPQKRFKCVFNQKTKSGNVHWIRSEVESMVELYRQNSNLAWVTQQYMIQNPNTEHTSESVRATAGQLRTLDINYPTDTEWKVTALVAEIASTMYEDQFFSSKEEAVAYALESAAEDIINDLIAAWYIVPGTK